MSDESTLRADVAHVVRDELHSLRPERAVYERKSNLYFLTSRATALANAEDAVVRAETAEKEAAEAGAAQRQSRGEGNLV